MSSLSHHRTLWAALLAAATVFALVQQTAPAQATTSRPTLSVKRQATATTFTLSGTTAQRSTPVRIQRWTGRSWYTAKTVKSSRNKYSTALTPTKTTVYRAVAEKKASFARTAPVYTDACGVRPHKTTSSVWSCTLADNFNGTTLDLTKWSPQTSFATGTPAARACYLDSPNNVAVAGGYLRLSLRKESTAVHCANDGGTANYSAGMITSYYKFSQKYGRFEARFKNTASTVPGLQEAFWLWPDAREVDTTTWPKSGEIDIVETYSSYPNLAIPFLHYTYNDNGGPIPGVNTAWACKANRGVFNTYRLEWGSASIKIYVNNTLCLTNRSADPAFAQKYIVALTQAMGTTGNELSAATPIPAQMVVDYVRVWR